MELDRRIAEYQKSLINSSQEENQHINPAQTDEEEALVDPKNHYSMPKSTKKFQILSQWLYKNHNDPALEVSTYFYLKIIINL